MTLQSQVTEQNEKDAFLLPMVLLPLFGGGSGIMNHESQW